jgi:hypothetical protein
VVADIDACVLDVAFEVVDAVQAARAGCSSPAAGSGTIALSSWASTLRSRALMRASERAAPMRAVTAAIRKIAFSPERNASRAASARNACAWGGAAAIAASAFPEETAGASSPACPCSAGGPLASRSPSLD